jgi:hypothetical protein
VPGRKGTARELADMGRYFWQVLTSEEIAEDTAAGIAQRLAFKSEDEFMRSRCLTSLPPLWLDILKVIQCGCSPSHTALVLGIPQDNVEEVLRSILQKIFEPHPELEKSLRSRWHPNPDAEPEYSTTSVWFAMHQDCCMAKPFRAAFHTHYPLADARGVQQPRERFLEFLRSIEKTLDEEPPRPDRLDKSYCDPPSARRGRQRHRPSGGCQR